MNLRQRLIAEGLGTAFLLAAIVGSGIMGEQLAGGNGALALLANSLATGAALAALIVSFGPVSGAHFNPAVSVMLAVRGDLPPRELPAYVAVQVAGAMLGVVAAQAMFGLPLLELSAKVRAGSSLVGSEFVATLGLLLIIHHASRHKPDAVPYAVACYITAAYWFTSSTAFANPAVTLARVFTHSLTGIRAQDAGGFIFGQACATAVVMSAIGLKRVKARRAVLTGSG